MLLGDSPYFKRPDGSVLLYTCCFLMNLPGRGNSTAVEEYVAKWMIQFSRWQMWRWFLNKQRKHFLSTMLVGYKTFSDGTVPKREQALKVRH